MTDQNKTLIVVILDKSGSMLKIADETVGGLNKFIEEQRALPGECNVTLALFDSPDLVIDWEAKTSDFAKSDSGYKLLYSNTPISEIKPITSEEYKPSGWTALIDAMVRTIDDTGYRLASIPESQRPGKVIVVTITDGQENASHKFKKEDVAARIQHQKLKYGWQFLFFGANQDAIAEAGQYGISFNNAMNYSHTGAGVLGTYAVTSASIESYRSTGDANTLNVNPTGSSKPIS